MGDRDREWEIHLRSLSSNARDSNYATDSASDPSLLNSVKFSSSTLYMGMILLIFSSKFVDGDADCVGQEAVRNLQEREIRRPSS